MTPAQIDAGQSATQSWYVENASACPASGGWSGSRDPIGGAESVTPVVTTAYTLSCNGDGGSASDSVTVMVNEAAPPVSEPTVYLTASPASIARGDSVTLSWSATDVDSCSASGDWSGTKPTSGLETVVLTGPAGFILTCSGDGGSASDTVSYLARGSRWLTLQ